MNRRIRTQSTRPPTHRFKEYLKPGALARLRDSKISTRSHPHYVLLTHRVNSAAHQQVQDDSNDNTPSPLTELPPEFANLNRGPLCFGRKKLGAARTFIGSVNHVVVSDNVVDPFISSVVSVANNNLLVH